MARKQMMSESEIRQSISSNSSPSINTLPMDLPNHRHRLNNRSMTTQESDRLIFLKPDKSPLHLKKSDQPPPPLPPKSTNPIIDTNTICPPRPPPRTSILNHRNQSLIMMTSDNCQKQSSSTNNPSDSSLA
ncbi:hypothetical protein BLA29_007587 [Euroglyphus maynei]|uniref:Uncharacterized protein n=1 Tax=Euroglyphus maynei TaxID=6958 RepID=A0A1Y3AS40_EURMA|nr:hypothetical protein BLA29_007587 [Euroglyphus maynei]